MSERLQINITEEQLRALNLNFLIDNYAMLKTLSDFQINLTAAVTGEPPEEVKEKFMEKLRIYTMETSASVIMNSEG